METWLWDKQSRLNVLEILQGHFIMRFYARNVMNNASLKWIMIMHNVTHSHYCNSLIILNNSRWIEDEESVNHHISDKHFVSLGLTCVSYMEQNGAGREAEVGNVGSELKPLQTREGIKDNTIFIPCKSCKQKGWNTVYHLTHNALTHRNNNYYSAL